MNIFQESKECLENWQAVVPEPRELIKERSMRDPKAGDYVCLNTKCPFFHKATEVCWGTNHNDCPRLHCKTCKRAKIAVFAEKKQMEEV